VPPDQEVTVGGRPVEVVVIGAGNRGSEVYGAYAAAHPDELRVVGVAEPDPARRARFAAAHGLPQDRCSADASALLAAPRFAELVIVATPDRYHVDHAVGALAAGYDVLLEKPIALDRPGLARLVAAEAEHPGTITVAHVLRYTPFFATVARLLDEGAIGELQGIDHTEHVGSWHFAHSYVRGNWRRSVDAGSLLLAKACHDLDLLRWLAGAPGADVASVGQRRHFRAERAPAGAPQRCLDGCPIEASCPYHAGRFYLEQLAGWDGPPASVLGEDPSLAGRREALRHGPYGRCVYRCDNDVVDHQVVLLRFANGVTATLTVTAFSADATRTVRYVGSHGELQGDLEGGWLELVRFSPTTPVRERLELPRAGPDPPPPWGAFRGHAGGDEGLLGDLVARARARAGEARPARARTSLAASVDSHLLAFAAEEARATGTVVQLTPLDEPTRCAPSAGTVR
jgi:predicted dehydrogenase